MFDLRKIEAFCKVCEQQSFSKAGDALFLSQPTVSAHIQALEREFETRLLDRMGRTVLPTTAGAMLYRHARRVFTRLETARAEIRALTREITGTLSIGSSTIPAHHVLPKILTAFTEAYPNVRPNLAVASSSTIIRQVQGGEIMAGIVGARATVPELASTPLLESDIIVIAPHSLADLPSVKKHGALLPELDFETAVGLPWILREQNSATRLTFENAVRLAGYNPRLLHPRFVVDSSHAATQYVQAGMGVSAATRIAVQDLLDRGDIRAFSITGIHARRQFTCIVNARRVPLPATTVFLEFLRSNTQHLRALQSDSP